MSLPAVFSAVLNMSIMRGFPSDSATLETHPEVYKSKVNLEHPGALPKCQTAKGNQYKKRKENPNVRNGKTD